MEIIAFNILKSCIRADITHKVNFDTKITSDFILFWKKFGTVDYYNNLPRPFFRIIVENQFQIDGIEFNSSLRLTVINKDQNEAVEQFHQIISFFRG